VYKLNDKLLSTLFIGIDVSLEKNHVTAIDFNENIYLKKNFDNNIPGSDSLVQLIIGCLKDFEFHHIIVGIEATSIYSTHIASYLASNTILKAFDTKVYVLNPKTTSKYRETFVDLQKTDPADSFLIADFARVGKIKVQPWKGDQHIALKRLTRHRLHIIELITAEKTYYQTNLFLKFSEFARLKGNKKLFSNKFGAVATSIIEELLSLDDIAYMSVEDLAKFISEKSRNHFTDPEKIAQKIQAAARNSYRLEKVAYDPITLALASSITLIKTYQKELKVIDSAIMKTMKGFQKKAYISLTSIPGIGPVFAAGIIAEIGDIRCFKNNDALAKYAGITWSRKDSGPFESDDTRLTKRGNKYLRYYLMEAANSVRRFDQEYHQYYLSKFNEVHTHQHRRAVSLTSRKLIRLIFCLLVKSSLYVPNYSIK
jgi:transposase